MTTIAKALCAIGLLGAGYTLLSEPISLAAGTLAAQWLVLAVVGMAGMIRLDM